MLYFAYSDLFDRKPSWTDVVERMGQYSLPQILDLIGRISAVHHRYGQKEAGRVQSFITRGLFQDDADDLLRRALHSFHQSVKGSGTQPNGFALFHDMQLVNAAKIALLMIPPDQESRTESLRPFGEALLMVSDLVRRGEIQPTDADATTEPGRRKWEQYLLVNGLFHARDSNVRHGVARSYDLYLTDRPHLDDGRRAYVNFPQVVKDVTGLSPDLLWTVLFALYSYWLRVDLDQPGRLPEALNKDTHFTVHFDFTDEDSDRFFSLAAADVSIVRRHLERRDYGPQDLRPYDVLPFEKSPLVLLDGRAYCVSAKLLERKLTRGLHYVFLNGIDPTVPDSAKREEYLRYIGDVFGDYVDGIFRRIYGSSGRYFGERELVAAGPEGSKVCDGLIVYPGRVILVETKATLFSLDIRTTGAWESLEAKLGDIFIRAARQIDATAAAIRSGAYKELGIDPARIQTYLPVVVTLQEIPMYNGLYNRVSDRLRSEQLLQDERMVDFQNIDVDGMELLETASEYEDVGDLLFRRVRDGGATFGNFISYCIAEGKPFTDGRNRYLDQRFEELAEQAVAILRRHETGHSTGPS